MKLLLLMRHGKSSWDYDLPDDQRPLKPRGYRDSSAVADAFLSLKIPLDAVYSSPAVRAHETCLNFLKMSGNTDKTPEIIDELYDFRGYNVLHFVKSLPDALENVMVFGHNHAFTALVNSLGDQPVGNLPTSGLAVIAFDVNHWSAIEKGKTLKLLIPKEL